MAIHKDLVGETAVHPFAIASESDPGAIGAYKAWVKISTGEVKVRNAANSAWVALSAATDLAAHLADTSDAHDASAISVLDTAGNFTGTDVETVLDELSDTIVSGGTPDASETVKGKAEIATQTETNTGTDDTRIVTPAKLAGRSATDTRAGVIEIATQTETDTGTDDARALTPAKLANYSGLAGLAVPDATETVKGKAEIATQTETNTGTDDTRIVTPAKLANYSGLTTPDATETVKGKAEIATQTETNTGTDDTRIVTPLKLKTYGDDRYVINSGGLGTTLDLDNLGDVVIASPSDGQVLTYDSGTSHWVNEAPSAGGSGTNHRTLVSLGSDQSTTSTTLSDITGLSFSVSSGVARRFDGILQVVSGLFSNGFLISVNGPGTPTILGFFAHYSAGPTSSGVIWTDTYDGGTLLLQTGDSTHPTATLHIRGIVNTNASGTFALRFRSENSGTSITVKAGSSLDWW